MKDINHKANTLPSKSTKVAGWVVNVFPLDNMRSAYIVILTAYEIFAQCIRHEDKEKTKIGIYFLWGNVLYKARFVEALKQS